MFMGCGMVVTAETDNMCFAARVPELNVDMGRDGDTVVAMKIIHWRLVWMIGHVNRCSGLKRPYKGRLQQAQFILVRLYEESGSADVLSSRPRNENRLLIPEYMQPPYTMSILSE